MSTTTDENGLYSFSDVPDGQYNIVAKKSGYGWRYQLNVDATTSIPDLKLFREKSVSGTIDTYTVWSADQHIIVNSDLTIHEGGTLLIDKGCVVRIGGNYEIKGDGGIQVNGTADDKVWFTANVPSNEPGYTAWRGISANGRTTINNARIDFAVNGIKTSSAEYVISHSLFDKVGDSGVLITRESTGTVENCAFMDCPTGIRIEGNSYADVDNNLFVTMAANYVGSGLVINASSAKVVNNLFRGFNIACSFEFNTFGSFLHNYLENCTTGLYVNKASFEAAKPVLFESNILKNCTKTAIDIYNCDSPIVEQNTILQSGKGLLISGYAVHWHDTKSVSFPQNYWGLTELNDILRYIDVRDNESETQPYTIYVAPILTEPPADAGPQ